MPRVGASGVGRLPIEVTSFVGRRRELAETKHLLGLNRLVTLIGVGGTGKTRLALRAAGEVRRAFPDGVSFVDLTELRDPATATFDPRGSDMVAYLIGAALGLREQGGSRHFGRWSTTLPTGGPWSSWTTVST